MLDLGQDLGRNDGWRAHAACSASFMGQTDLSPAHSTILALMAELGACSALLTFHHDAGARPTILSSLGVPLSVPGLDALLDAATAAAPSDDHIVGHAAQHTACRTQEGDVLVLPFVSRAASSHIMLSMTFNGAMPQRQGIRAALHYCWPLLDGYFRCWQGERHWRGRTLATEAALNLLDFGVVLVTRAGHACFVNDAADKMLEAGHAVRRRGGVLVAAKLAENMMLQSSLASAIAASDRSMAEIGPSDGGSLLKLGAQEHRLICAAVPLDYRAEAPGDCAAMLILIDPAYDPDRLVQPLCRLYGLSPVETRLACHLVRGASLGDASKALRIKEQTARSYLKQIFAKLNVRRQVDLVRMLLTSAVRSRPFSPKTSVLHLAPK